MFVIRNMGNLRANYYNYVKFFLAVSFVCKTSKSSSDYLKVDLRES